jgi:hypothetical protein
VVERKSARVVDGETVIVMMALVREGEQTWGEFNWGKRIGRMEGFKDVELILEGFMDVELKDLRMWN